MTPPEGSSDPSVGSRLSCDGHIGTLLYVGEVPPTKGTWFGVDWDDPTKVSLGRPLPDAIKERYGEVEGSGVDKQEVDQLQKETGAKFIEMVGFEKVNKQQSQFHQLTVVCVRDHLVNGPGPAGALQALCPDVTELDISRNLLNSWHAVAQIAAQLKRLQHLNVRRGKDEREKIVEEQGHSQGGCKENGGGKRKTKGQVRRRRRCSKQTRPVAVNCSRENRLQIGADPSEHQGSFQSLKQLVAWDMKYDWSHFLACARMWPHIEELKG
uniref:Tubulin-specific chaperone E n=1 Tax=Timema douglasi TaxID=61478 RepID=A0A7R8VTP4_TIMDO|nr:unnamed protein product [Timema douglasi]